jgi:hypothetical protein
MEIRYDKKVFGLYIVRDDKYNPFDFLLVNVWKLSKNFLNMSATIIDFVSCRKN